MLSEKEIRKWLEDTTILFNSAKKEGDWCEVADLWREICMLKIILGEVIG